MPFNFHVGLPGPFSYSRRIGGGPGIPAPTVAELRAQSRAADLMDAETLRTRNGVDWILVFVFAVVMLLIGSVWSVLAALVVAALVWWRHRRRAERRRAATAAAVAEPIPAVPGRHRR